MKWFIFIFSSTGKSNDEKVLELLKSMLEDIPSSLIKEVFEMKIY